MSDAKKISEEPTKELVKKDIDGLANLVFKNRQDSDSDDEIEELATLIDLVHADLSSIHDTLKELRSQIKKLRGKKSPGKPVTKEESKKNNIPNGTPKKEQIMGLNNFSLEDDDADFRRALLMSQKEH